MISGSRRLLLLLRLRRDLHDAPRGPLLVGGGGLFALFGVGGGEHGPVGVVVVGEAHPCCPVCRLPVAARTGSARDGGVHEGLPRCGGSPRGARRVQARYSSLQRPEFLVCHRPLANIGADSARSDRGLSMVLNVRLHTHTHLGRLQAESRSTQRVASGAAVAA